LLIVQIGVISFLIVAFVYFAMSAQVRHDGKAPSATLDLT
jgi:hypothetical protein